MSPLRRKALLAVHLVASVGWVGGAVAYVALGVAARTTTDPATIRAAWLAFDILGWWVLVPEAVLTLVTGVALSLGTRWGLFLHYWVVVALLVTLLCTVVLVLHMRDVSATAALARTADAAELRRLGGDLAHPTIGLVLLLFVLVLNVFKPRGVTRRGWRRQQQGAR